MSKGVFNRFLVGLVVFIAVVFLLSYLGISNWQSKLRSTENIHFSFDNSPSYKTSEFTNHDSSGNEYKGKVYGATWNRIKGVRRGGYSFDGVDDYISINDSDLFSPNDRKELTISFWMKPATFRFSGTSIDSMTENRVSIISKIEKSK